MDSRINDDDEDLLTAVAAMPDENEEGADQAARDEATIPQAKGAAVTAAGGGKGATSVTSRGLRSHADFRRRAAELYADYEARQHSRFRWLRSELFTDELAADLEQDAQALLSVLTDAGDWDADKDAKLNALCEFLTDTYPEEKVLVFTQFADTVAYVAGELKRRGVERLAGVTGDSENPTRLAWRFSPTSNNKRAQIAAEDELRVLIATDVLSEGQNLQDCSIVVNYDLPWAIIRLVQRAGRVDRIGQQAERILVHSFLPADGVERILRLRARVRQRLRENAEVVGADETFFEDDDDQAILDLYNENAAILDIEADTEVDLASYAFQIWKNALESPFPRFSIAISPPTARRPGRA